MSPEQDATLIRLRALLVEVVSGNAIALAPLARVDHRSIVDAWESSPKPPVTRLAVLRVLNDLAAGTLSQEEAGDWGKFIFYGHLAGVAYPFKSLDIEYDEIDDEVAESVMKLEWIGDDVDGVLDGERLTTQIDRLRSFLGPQRFVGPGHARVKECH